MQNHNSFRAGKSQSYKTFECSLDILGMDTRVATESRVDSRIALLLELPALVVL